MTALEKHLPGQESIGRYPAAPSPKSLDDTGLESTYLIDLLVKTVFRNGLERPSAMSLALKLPPRVIDQIIEIGERKGLFEKLGQLGANLNAEMKYALTNKGRAWAQEALNFSDWTGAAPVPLENYIKVMKDQSVKNEVLSRQRLDHVFRDLIIPDELMKKLGPAANSGASILIYGPPGNGKSTVSEALCEAYQDLILVPYVVAVDNQVIRVFDPEVHEVVSEGDGIVRGLRHALSFDQRYALCKRPGLIAGGELTLEMLDLSYSPISRTYTAPLQMKANGGVFVIDDFGRQRQSPQDIVNRLIIPLEKRVDFLALQSGRKFEVPFELLVVFSTNKMPEDLVDEAALRRLRHKILMDRPSRDTYIRIFLKTAKAYGLSVDEDLLAFVLFELYEESGRNYSSFHPKFLIEQSLSICSFEGCEPQLRPDFMKRAWENLTTGPASQEEA
ncbi:AAA family ATPase [Rhodobacteraceae bacterium NNCM2]|nr:AAA family ATPase [Coraliihabitans acroporae]